jgi:hypothetical protein
MRAVGQEATRGLAIRSGVRTGVTRRAAQCGGQLLQLGRGLMCFS